MLTAAQSGLFTVLKYLARGGGVAAPTTDNWDPTAGVTTPTSPQYTVAADGQYKTVQSAITAAVSAGGTARINIAVSAGTYTEVVCVPKKAPPITLYGTGTDPSQTTIVYNNYNGKATGGSSATNACTGTSSGTYGTNGSATFAAFADGFQAKNLTISNNVNATDLGSTSGTQAVALMTEADKIVLDSVRILGHQDSLYLETPSADTIARAYLKNSSIAGDTDFIFGGATAVFDGCTIESVSDRKSSGNILAPDTDARNPYGILISNGKFTADSSSLTGVGLGRAWDHNCKSGGAAAYVENCLSPNSNGAYPNGQATIRNSTLGAHIDITTPWNAAATTARPYSSTPVADCGGHTGVTCPAARLYEFQNSR